MLSYPDASTVNVVDSRTTTIYLHYLYRKHSDNSWSSVQEVKNHLDCPWCNFWVAEDDHDEVTEMEEPRQSSKKFKSGNALLDSAAECNGIKASMQNVPSKSVQVCNLI